jgi:hypothetical protein
MAASSEALEYNIVNTTLISRSQFKSSIVETVYYLQAI